MMYYRVRMKAGFYERWFEFSNIQEAAEFAKTILEHQVVNEDFKEKQVSVIMEIVDLMAEKEQEEK